MKLTIAIIALVSVAFAKKCERGGYWGEDCNKVCGACAEKAPCDFVTGKCPDGKCEENWRHQKNTPGACNEAECFGNVGCGESGKCIAPNYCICGEQGAQVVGKTVTKDGIEGIDCVSLRKDGIKGAFIAMVVMFVSVGFCGTIEYMRNKNKGSKRHAE